jgi:hypothetical protein
VKREGLPDLGHHRQRATGRRRHLDRRGDDPDTWHPASVPFPAATLVGFDIAADGKIVVTIPLRP